MYVYFTDTVVELTEPEVVIIKPISETVLPPSMVPLKDSGVRIILFPFTVPTAHQI